MEYYRSASFAEAARRLNVNETTVSRRLRKLEKELGQKLIIWSGKNPTGLSGDALNLVNSLFEAETAIASALGPKDLVRSSIRLSAVPFILNHILIPKIGGYLDGAKDLEIELIPEHRNVDLSKREADIALRFSRPHEGGQAILAQKIGVVDFVPIALRNVPNLPWIKYEPGSSYLPQSDWTEDLAKDQKCSPMLVADIDGALGAVLAGFGKALLPSSLIKSYDSLSLIDECRVNRTREVWMLTHKTSLLRPKLEMFKKWLRQLDFE